MAIENTVSIDFLSTFVENTVSIDFLSTLVDSVNVFDCRLPGVV